jgi:endonuclease-8
MPEGDTIHRAAATLARALVGRTVTRFETGYAQLARVDDDAPIAGRTVDDVRAVGKHLLMTFSGGLTLRTHMRMNGSWHVYRPGERWQRPRRAMRVLIETDAYVAVGFDVPVAEFLDDDELVRSRELRRRAEPTVPAPARSLVDPGIVPRARRIPDRPIGDVLLDQTVAAGVGNVYRCEVLFLCGVHPDRSVASLSDDALARLYATAEKLLRANVAPGSPAGIRTYAGLRRTTGRANPGERLWVYGRGGKPCRRCGTPIAFARRGPHARVTYFCSRCQPR